MYVYKVFSISGDKFNNYTLSNMISGLVLLALAGLFWFGVAKDASKESSTAFIRVWKGIFGVKGYILTAKILAVILALASLSEFYKYFVG